MFNVLAVLLTCTVNSGHPMSKTNTDTARVSEPITAEASGLRLHGTLQLPTSKGPFPVVLIIAGSGPTDRDGNSPLLPGRNNGLKMLAEALADCGIASVRYDKRGIGESAVPGFTEADLKFTLYSDDAASWITQLRKDPRFNRVIVAGHSEGALLGTLAARTANADGLVLIAGAGRPIAEVLREQLRGALPANLMATSDSILDQLAQRKSVANVPAELMMLYRPSIQPYMISWLPLDPAAELAKLTIPVAVIRGTTDIQAARADLLRLAGANPKIRMVEVEGMNHVLKLASGTPQEQMPSYSDPNLPVAPALIDAVVEFVRGVAGISTGKGAH